MIQTTAATDQVVKHASALVVYASTHGHTARIAARIAEAMRAHGVEADLHDVASAGDAEPGLYDVVGRRRVAA